VAEEVGALLGGDHDLLGRLPDGAATERAAEHALTRQRSLPSSRARPPGTAKGGEKTAVADAIRHQDE